MWLRPIDGGRRRTEVGLGRGWRGERVEAQEGRTEDRGHPEATKAGGRRGGLDTGFDPRREPRVGAVEHATAEDHLHLVPGHRQPPDHGAGHGRHLVGQEAGRLGCRPVAVGGGIEADPGQLEQPAVLEGTGVDGGQYRLGVGQIEVGRDSVGEGRGPSAPVAGPERQTQGPDPEP